MTNYRSAEDLLLYNHWLEFMNLVRQEWPGHWQDYDTVRSAYEPYIDPEYSGLDYTNDRVFYRVEVCSHSDNEHDEEAGVPLRWLVATLWDSEFPRIDPTSETVFAQSIAYARAHMTAMPRFALIVTDDEIPPHVDTDPEDMEDYLYNITCTVHGSLTLTVGCDTRTLAPGGMELWDAGETHHAPHTGFWGAIIGSVSSSCIRGK